jgi:hypothetical protein
MGSFPAMIPGNAFHLLTRGFCRCEIVQKTPGENPQCIMGREYDPQSAEVDPAI